MVGQSILYIIVLESKKSADIHCTEYLEVNSIWRYVRFFADHRVIFVVRVVRVAQPPVGAELELKELVSELPLVPDVVAAVEILKEILSNELSVS